ncbi:MAG: TetR/AcrR family transcriptional regulator C-terminal domain-containing protein, partial [Leptolyngbyaceae cyanobacterium]
GRFPQLAQAFVAHIEQTAFRQLCRYFTTTSQLDLKDPEATARIFVGSLVHFVIVQEMLHGREVLPMERDRLVDALVDLVVQE